MNIVPDSVFLHRSFNAGFLTLLSVSVVHAREARGFRPWRKETARYAFCGAEAWQQNGSCHDTMKGPVQCPRLVF